jgi:uncharacterized protein (DUF2132 family)
MKDKTNIDNSQINNPLHGIRLVDMLEFLVKEYGKDKLEFYLFLKITP